MLFNFYVLCRMIEKTGGILLHRIKYSDSRLILKIFTEKFGLRSYMFYLSKTKNKKHEQNILQPLYVYDLEVYDGGKCNICKIKNISLKVLFKSLPFDIYKQSLSMFLSEFILKISADNEPDDILFDFIFNSVKELDEMQISVADFHLFFLYRLSGYLGILPENNYSDSHKIFDLKTGRFITGHPSHSFFLDEKMSFNLYKLACSQKYETLSLRLNKNDRASLLNALIDFYNLHLGRPGKMKSPEILKQVFS